MVGCFNNYSSAAQLRLSGTPMQISRHESATHKKWAPLSIPCLHVASWYAVLAGSSLGEGLGRARDMVVLVPARIPNSGRRRKKLG